MTHELAKKRGELHTVLVENIMLSKETGFPERQTWCLYSAPCLPDMAAAIAENLKRANKSFRIVTNDNKPGAKIISQWWRKDFRPDDGKEENRIVEITQSS